MSEQFEKWRYALQDRPTDTTEWEFEIWKAGALAMRERAAKACQQRGEQTKNGEWHGNNHAAASFAETIRELPVSE